MTKLNVKVAAGGAAAVVVLSAGIGFALTSGGGTPAPSAASSTGSAERGGAVAGLPSFTMPAPSGSAAPSTTPAAPSSAPRAAGSGGGVAQPGTVRSAHPVGTLGPVTTVKRPAPAPDPASKPTPSGKPPVPPSEDPSPSPSPTPTPSPVMPPTVTPTPDRPDDTLPPDVITAPPPAYNYQVGKVCDVLDLGALSALVGQPLTDTAAATPKAATPGMCSLRGPVPVAAGDAMPREVTVMVQPTDSPYILNQLKSLQPMDKTPGTGQAYAGKYTDDVFSYVWIDGPHAVAVALTYVPAEVHDQVALPVARTVLDWLAQTNPQHPTFPTAVEGDGVNDAVPTTPLVAGAAAGAAGLVAFPGFWLYRRRYRRKH